MTWKPIPCLGLGLGILSLALVIAPENAQAQRSKADRQAEEVRREAEKAQGQAEEARRRILIRPVDPQRPGQPQDPIDLKLQRFFSGQFQGQLPTETAEIRGMEGLGLQPVNDAYRAHLTIPEGHGLVVTEVAEDSRAAKVGIQKNDILLEVSREDVEIGLTQADDLANFLQGQLDKPYSIKLLRAGKEETLEVPAVEETAAEVPQEYYIGISIAPLDEALRTQLDLDLEDGQGIVVMETVEDSPAAEAGLRANDILISINDEPIQGVESLIETIQEIAENAATFEYLRKGETNTVEITPAARPASPDRPRPGARPGPETFRFFGPGIMVDPETGQVRPGGPPGLFPLPRVGPDGRPFQFRGDGGEFRIEMPEDLRKEMEQMREELDKLRKELEDQFRQMRRPAGPDQPKDSKQDKNVPKEKEKKAEKI